MKIDVYQTKLSVKPFTSWRSMADMLNYLEENKKIASICQKIRETGDLSLKDGLPAMMPMGDVGDLQRKKENCEPTGLVMIDIDNKTLSGQEVRSLRSRCRHCHPSSDNTCRLLPWTSRCPACSPCCRYWAR